MSELRPELFAAACLSGVFVRRKHFKSFSDFKTKPVTDQFYGSESFSLQEHNMETEWDLTSQHFKMVYV